MQRKPLISSSEHAKMFTVILHDIKFKIASNATHDGFCCPSNAILHKYKDKVDYKLTIDVPC